MSSIPQYNVYNVQYFTRLYAYFHTFGGIFKQMAEIRFQRFLWGFRGCRFRILYFQEFMINILLFCLQ